MNQTGVVKAIAFCSAKREPMQEIDRAEVLVGLGLANEPWHKNKRGVTLLSTSCWADACRELKTQLPWTLRRANVLIEGLNLPATVGKIIVIGSVRLLVHDETRPCGLMDQQHMGLRQALTPSLRGGVHAEVIAGGELRVGQSVRME